MSEHLNVMLKFYQDNDRMIETIERINDSYLEMLDALEVAEAENDRLREVVSDGEESARLILHESRALQAENDMLWDLVLDYEHCTMHADCSMCEYDGKLSTHCPLSPYFPDIDELRELGVDA